MDFEGVYVGFVGALVFIVMMAIASFVSEVNTQKDIALSCELSKHVVISEKAYRCELID
jgi:hypothetical protein